MAGPIVRMATRSIEDTALMATSATSNSTRCECATAGGADAAGTLKNRQQPFDVFARVPDKGAAIVHGIGVIRRPDQLDVEAIYAATIANDAVLDIEPVAQIAHLASQCLQIDWVLRGHEGHPVF